MAAEFRDLNAVSGRDNGSVRVRDSESSGSSSHRVHVYGRSGQTQRYERELSSEHNVRLRPGLQDPASRGADLSVDDLPEQRSADTDADKP